MARTKNSLSEAAAGSTVIGSEISVRGRIEGEEDLRVYGEVEGSITLSDTLYVEDGGVVQAKVEARNVVISGIVIGDVVASDSISLNAGAKLVGNIEAPRIIIADGAAFRGEVAMEGDFQSSSTRGKTTATPARRSNTRPNRISARKNEDARKSTASKSAAKPAASNERGSSKRRSEAQDEEVTVVIKHSALRKGEAPEPGEAASESKSSKRPSEGGSKRAVKKAAKKKAGKKKAPRVPARGKRRVARR